MKSSIKQATELRKIAYRILDNNKFIPWVEMWEIDRAASYLKQAKEYEKNKHR